MPSTRAETRTASRTRPTNSTSATTAQNFPYFDFAPMFRAELYNPDHWADVFQRSGAKYVVLTSKHHEGFTLWPTSRPTRPGDAPGTPSIIGPKRDLIALDLMEAVAAAACTWESTIRSTSGTTRCGSPTRSATSAEHMFPQFKDVVTHLKPCIIFSDGEWDIPSADWRSPELLAWLFNESPVQATKW